MNQTQNYKLPQWERDDRIMMSDFNSQAQKLEAALTAHDAAFASLASSKADKTTANNLQTQINAKADTSALNTFVNGLQTQINSKVGLVVGKYTGDNAKSQTISLGFQPKAVMVLRNDGEAAGDVRSFCGLAAPGLPAIRNEKVYLEVTANGFVAGNVSLGGGWGSFLNDSQYSYHYVAFR